jgi:hypothetical protein
VNEEALALWGAVTPKKNLVKLKFLSCVQVKGNETSGVCVSYGGREGAFKLFWQIKSEGKCFRNQDVNGRIITDII